MGTRRQSVKVLGAWKECKMRPRLGNVYRNIGIRVGQVMEGQGGLGFCGD